MRAGKLIGWVRKINRRAKWICSAKVAPTADDADVYYEKNFFDLWSEPEPADPDADVSPEQVTLDQIRKLFLARKLARVEADRLQQRSYDEYEEALVDFCKAVGGSRRPAQLHPKDFDDYHNELAKRFGIDRRAKFVVMVRSMFKFATRAPLNLPLPDYGDEFKRPSQADFKKARKRDREARGKPKYEPEDVRKLLAKAGPTMKAMILLAINAGFGNTDVAELPVSVLDLKSGWIEYSRGKTGADRRAKLWPETIAAIKAYLKVRPNAADEKTEPLLFRTIKGNSYVHVKKPNKRTAGKEKRQRIKDGVSVLFGQVADAAGVKRRGFYSLRRTYRTIAAERGNAQVIDLTMGHAADYDDMAAVYTVEILDELLELVSNHVRSRILIKPKRDAKGGAPHPRSSAAKKSRSEPSGASAEDASRAMKSRREGKLRRSGG